MRHSAAALGLMLGVAIASVIEMMDDTMRSPGQFEEFSGLALLGVIPIAPQLDDRIAQLNEPSSGVSKAYRSLATALRFSTSSGLPRSFAVTSAGPGEGRWSTCVALARQFAMIRHNVLLVDADLRMPSLHTKLGLDNSMGLSNDLMGSVAPPEVSGRPRFLIWCSLLQARHQARYRPMPPICLVGRVCSCSFWSA